MSGYVHLREEEVETIAGFLKMPLRDFTDRYTRLTDTRTGLSLIEHDDHTCIFLEDDNTCLINDVKPLQCRNFPMKWNFKDWKKICGGDSATE